MVTKNFYYMAKRMSQTINITETSAINNFNKIDPICQHFGICGGCQYQDWERSSYESYKLEILNKFLAEKDIKCTTDKLVSCEPHTRRRVTFHAQNQSNGFIFGFFKPASHELFEVAECPISVPEIEKAIPTLKKIASLCASNKAIHLTVISAENGLDISLSDVENLTDQKRKSLTKFTNIDNILRISVNNELIIEEQKPFLSLDSDNLFISSGVFLQSTKYSEQVMIDLCKRWLKKQKNVVDLFSGIGTFSLPMSHLSSVDSYDTAVEALDYLNKSTKQITGIKKLQTTVRDLFKRPLTHKELEKYNGLIIDPPRSGALEQTKEIAKSYIPKVVMISCNPQSLARDLSILQAGGYKINEMIPIDQFLWTSHLEVVTLLSKDSPKRKWKL